MMEKALLDFLSRVQAQNLGVEAIAVATPDDILFEHHFVRCAARNIYSHSKSFTSTAVGLAIGDGLLSLDDRPVDFFPESLPADIDAGWQKVTLRHCLMMSSGAGVPLLMMDKRGKGEGFPDYLRYIFSHPITVEPGTQHLYSNGDTYLCGRMVEKVTSKTLTAYLYERLLRPMGIDYPAWEADPQGHTFGASGMYLPIRSQIRLGQLYLGQGKWQGQQLLDPAWVQAAGSKQIDTAGEESTWLCGYGYQFWSLGYPGAYRADGAYGQITAILPEKNLTVSIQCPESGNFDLVRPVFLELLETL